MKNVVLSLVAAFAVLALPALAQSSDTGESNLTGSTVQEERTAPDTGSIAPGSGLTLTGEVVSWNDQQLVVKTTTGVEHIQLDASTTRPSSFLAGDKVVVDYTRTSSNGVMIARAIRPLGTTASTTTSTTTLTTPMGESQLEQDVEEAVDEVGDAADRVGAEISEVDDEVEEEIEEAVGAPIDNDGAIGNDEIAANDTDSDTELDTALPATGSKAPLVGLLGLLALGAAAGLRRL
jgi:hypothetical protein